MFMRTLGSIALIVAIVVAPLSARADLFVQAKGLVHVGGNSFCRLFAQTSDSVTLTCPLNAGAARLLFARNTNPKGDTCEVFAAVKSTSSSGYHDWVIRITDRGLHCSYTWPDPNYYKILVTAQ